MRQPLPAAPTISVVIRNHNYGKYLEEAVSSAAGQSRPPDEVVVVDDGSTDDSADVIDRFVALGLVTGTVRRASPKGPAASFNDGVAATTGDLVLALDADDRLSSRYLELTAQALAESGADFAYGGEHRFGAEVSEQDAKPFDAEELGIENLVHVSALFRRWMFDETGGFSADMDGCGLEDWEFWVAGVERGAVGVAVDGCWLEYRRHEVGSRNTITHLSALRAHVFVHRRHPAMVSRRHLTKWMARSVRRNAARLAGRRRGATAQQI